MPSPLSRTTMRMPSSRVPSTVTVTVPLSGVNLIALDRRFQITCCRRSGSPCIGARGSALIWSLMLFAPAAGCTAASAASTTAATSIDRSVSRSLPVMMRETSSRSSMSWATDLALRSIVSSARSRRSGSRSPRRSHQVHPTSALSGVRSSWDSVARNSSLARLAVSAVARAACSSRSSHSRARASASAWRCARRARS